MDIVPIGRNHQTLCVFPLQTLLCECNPSVVIIMYICLEIAISFIALLKFHILNVRVVSSLKGNVMGFRLLTSCFRDLAQHYHSTATYYYLFLLFEMMG